MVGATRFELATFRSRTERSTKLSHAPRVTFKYTKALAKCQRKLRNFAGGILPRKRNKATVDGRIYRLYRERKIDVNNRNKQVEDGDLLCT